MKATNSSRQKGLHSVGLIIGLSWAFVYTGVWLSSYVSAISYGDYSLGLILLIIIPLISFSGLAIAWKRPFIGGVLMVIGGLFLVVYNPTIDMQTAAIFVTSLPPVISGILFLLLHWERHNIRIRFSSKTRRGNDYCR